MSTSFRPYAPHEPFLLPPDPREWLPEDHLAYFVSDTVDALDLSAFYAPYEGDGRRKQPYEPAMMLKVLIYGYATGVFSSRGLARKLREDIAFRVLAAGNYPAHRTLCEFRKRNRRPDNRLPWGDRKRRGGPGAQQTGKTWLRIRCPLHLRRFCALSRRG